MTEGKKPAREWKAGDRAVVEIVDAAGDACWPGYIWVKTGIGEYYVPISALSPLSDPLHPIEREFFEAAEAWFLTPGQERALGDRFDAALYALLEHRKPKPPEPPPDSLRVFLNQAKSLQFVDRTDVPELSDDNWRLLTRDPLTFMMKANDATATVVWREIEKHLGRVG